jgi:hypothetical protein
MQVLSQSPAFQLTMMMAIDGREEVVIVVVSADVASSGLR